MQSVPPRALPLLAAILLCAVSLPAAEPKTTQPADEEPFAATLLSAAAGKLVFSHDGKNRTLPAADLVTWGAPVDARSGTLIVLPGGGLLVVDVVKSDNDRLIVDSAPFGELTLPLENLAGIVFHPPADARRRDELLLRAWNGKGDIDCMVLDNGDELTGTVLSLDAKSVSIEAKVGKVDVDTDRIAALVFNSTLVNRPRQQGLRMLVGLDDGTRLVVASLTVDAKQAVLKLPDGPTWKCPAERIVSLQALTGGRVTYLSDLKPSGYRHVPLLELPWEYRADRNVLGMQLRSGGSLYPKGVGMHSAARLTYPLDGRFRRFAAEAAIDSQTAGRGSVVFRVFVDAEQKYASPIVRGDSPVLPIVVDLPEGARSLSLIVDFADRGDEQDHANWLNARLIE